jgi:hypothetical protein
MKFSFLIFKALFIMKRVKIMLTAITVLAAVGGALAFKDRTFGGKTYCITTDPNAIKCPIRVTSAEVVPGALIAYTLIPNGAICTVNTPCNKKGGSWCD